MRNILRIFQGGYKFGPFQNDTIRRGESGSHGGVKVTGDSDIPRINDTGVERVGTDKSGHYHRQLF